MRLQLECLVPAAAELRGITIEITNIQDFNEQWALCGKCKERIEYTALDVIEAFEILHPPETGSD